MTQLRRSPLKLALSSLLGFSISMGMGAVCSQAVAQERSFKQWCDRAARLSAPERHTVSVLLEVAGTENCAEAEQALLAMVNLDLGMKEIENIAPLGSLTHLKGLNLSFNQITDISPLANLPELSFLLLAGNKIKDITPLGNLPNLGYVVVQDNQIRKLPESFPKLQQLRSLNLLNNPLAEKRCPVTPATVCVFSNDAVDLFAQAEDIYEKGNFEEALETFRQALAVYEKSGDRRKQADALNRMGDSYSQLSEYAKSIAIRRQVLGIRRELVDLPGLGESLTSLADSYEKLGQYPQAQEAIEEALVVMDKQERGGIPLEGGLYELPKDQGQLYNALARVQNKVGKHEEALSSAKRALKYYELLPDGYNGKDYGIRTTLDQIGSTYGYLEQPQQGKSLLMQALSLGEEIGDRAGIATTLTHLGDLARTAGETQVAVESYQKALELRKAIGDRAGSGLIYDRIGTLYLDRDNSKKAIPPLREAIAIWEELRPGLRDEDKVSLFETQAATYEKLQQALIAEQQGEAALEVAERGRARAFVELLAARLSGKPSERFSAPEPPTLEDIRRIAKEQQATIVEYSIVGEILYIWVIQPNGTIELRSVELETLGITLEDAAERTRVAAVTGRSRGVQQGVNEWVESTRAGVQETVKEPTTSTPSTPQKKRKINRRLKKSYQLLIEPIVDLLPSNIDDRIIFIPQGSLFLVPFPALQDNDGMYLIEKHTVLAAPSIQVLGLTHERSQQLRSNRGTPLVVGNPTMPSLAPAPEKKPEPLSPLPGAEAEAVVIANLLGTEAIIGDRATEETIASRMEKAPWIHLATHGLLDQLEVLGFRSPGALALTPSGTTSETDGWLTSEEILDLKLTAQMVVLSACSTGRGEITGDGIIGLSRSLIAAGTPSVLVSLWDVDDNPTSALMQTFYQELEKTSDRSAALRQAMLATMQEYPNPRSWAAFTLVGEAMGHGK
ncbi:CHAT domain-containing protein [Roseofilum casamattae]|uniref:CHAT domain-containing protein n=1 Tax=Roseofilum casamattae BLCC-M143 TaxID=3022442 RepID=A0ABT7BYU0_9CYAN|nr:CHAT domain-containing protein [Roseofilum casamattae]MDJ1184363.1 CHAT domain-containing protein [Roseofilum casamattae BLCC-M143]